MRNVLTYGDINSSNYGIYIGQETIYNVPERAVEVVSVPGRNGALTIDQGHYENVSIEYYCFVDGETEEEMHRKYNAFKNAIASVVGYQKIIDSYYPDEYRLGLFIEGIEADSVALGKGLEFRLIFNCKPQRYLTSGDTEVTVSDGDVINNPTLFDSQPLLMVKGYGDIEFNGYKIELESGSIGNVNLWQSSVFTKRITNTLTITGSENFDNLMFENGDTFSFDVSHGIDIYDEVSTMTKTNANATNAWTDNNDGSIRLATTLPCTFAVGTSSNVTNTSVFSFISTESLTADMTVSYDGVGTVTFTTSYTATDPSTLGINMNEYIGACTATSSLTLLGNPTYIDCEIGEAYKYEGDSLIGLNSYIDLGSDLPKLSKGINTFTIDDTITSLTLVPRFWQL